MGKLTRKELEDLEYYVELAKSRLKDANPALLTFGRVLTALLQDRLATLPEEAKPSEAEALWRETLPQGQAGWLLGNPFKEGAVVGKPQPERCGGSPGEPRYKTLPHYETISLHGWHDWNGIHNCSAGLCIPCPGCPDCAAKPWHLQAAEAIWEREHMEEPQRHQYLGTEEIAAIIQVYAERGEKR